MEGIVRKKLEEYFYKHKLLVDEQHGFVRSKSCSTNLLETLDFITSCVANDIPVDIPLLDFRKAFDSVIHRGLGVKLDSYGVKGFLIRWLMSFLTDRRQRVVMGDIISVWMEVFSGVPQGSVIGPFLFVIFINDLSRRIKNKLKIYADDTKILSKMRDSEDQKTLQMDLDEALKWSKEWLLDFNIDKCLIMHYGTNNKEYQYQMDNKILPKSGSERDLGVVFNRNLKWKEQVTVCASKANQMLGMLKKSFIYFDEYTMKTLYCAFVRPLIEFAVPVWCPNLKQDIKLLEQVQHRATKLVPSLSNLKYEDRLQILGLTTLSDRRKRGDLIQIFKIVHGYETVTWEKPLEWRAKNLRHQNSLNYSREITKTEARHNFFTNRIANEWNKLPEDVISAKSVNSFKAKLDKIIANSEEWKFKVLN